MYVFAFGSVFIINIRALSLYPNPPHALNALHGLVFLRPTCKSIFHSFSFNFLLHGFSRISARPKNGKTCQTWRFPIKNGIVLASLPHSHKRIWVLEMKLRIGSSSLTNMHVIPLVIVVEGYVRFWAIIRHVRILSSRL